MDELAVNVYRREENAASLAVKFLKAGVVPHIPKVEIVNHSYIES